MRSLRSGVRPHSCWAVDKPGLVVAERRAALVSAYSPARVACALSPQTKRAPTWSSDAELANQRGGYPVASFLSQLTPGAYEILEPLLEETMRHCRRQVG